jgi:hypothetical protein
LLERAGRILIPFLAGIFLIVPIHLYLWRGYYRFGNTYTPNPGHLWFLGNIVVYVIILSPVLFYLKNNENGKIGKWIKICLGHPLGLLPFTIAFVAEVILVDPHPYELYAMTWHGFFLGMVAFFTGFCFVLGGDAFWTMILKWRWLFLVMALILFIVRLFKFQQYTPGYLIAIESNSWILSVLAFGHRYLNRPGKLLRYLSQAAYPVYIIHMIFLYLGSLLIFPLNIGAPLQFILLLLFTGIGCFAFYEWIIRRVNFMRPIFGLKRE